MVCLMIFLLQRHAFQTAAVAAAVGAVQTIAFLYSRDMQPQFLIVAVAAAGLSAVAVACRVISIHQTTRRRMQAAVAPVRNRRRF